VSPQAVRAAIRRPLVQAMSPAEERIFLAARRRVLAWRPASSEGHEPWNRPESKRRKDRSPR